MSSGHRLKISMVSDCCSVAQCGINNADFVLTCGGGVCVCYLAHSRRSFSSGPKAALVRSFKN